MLLQRNILYLTKKYNIIIKYINNLYLWHSYMLYATKEKYWSKLYVWRDCVNAFEKYIFISVLVNLKVTIYFALWLNNLHSQKHKASMSH